jgi:Zn-dependent protease
VVFLLIGGIGLPGGAVWLDRHSIRGGKVVQSLVSLVGPLANVLCAIALGIPFLLKVATFAHLNFWSGIAFLGFLQVFAAILNLLPIPGVDGGNAVRPWLSYQGARIFDVLAPWGMLILFLALFQVPFIQILLHDIGYGRCGLLGIPEFVIVNGLLMFQFWR